MKNKITKILACGAILASKLRFLLILSHFQPISGFLPHNIVQRYEIVDIGEFIIENPCKVLYGNKKPTKYKISRELFPRGALFCFPFYNPFHKVGWQAKCCKI